MIFISIYTVIGSYYVCTKRFEIRARMNAEPEDKLAFAGESIIWMMTWPWWFHRF